MVTLMSSQSTVQFKEELAGITLVAEAMPNSFISLPSSIRSLQQSRLLMQVVLVILALLLSGLTMVTQKPWKSMNSGIWEPSLATSSWQCAKRWSLLQLQQQRKRRKQRITLSPHLKLLQVSQATLPSTRPKVNSACSGKSLSLKACHTQKAH